MASFIPEHPKNPAENASPGQRALEGETLSPAEHPNEPRLLTRRDANDGVSGRVSRPPAEPGALDAVRGRPERTRRRTLHVAQTLGKLRARIGLRERGRDGAAFARSGDRPRSRRAAVRALRRLAVMLGVLLLLASAALACVTLLLRHDMRAALPPLEGDLHLAGLAAPVTVTRDEQGVPTLRAATVSDLLFAQGFVTAQDRLWQMDALRRHVAGELAEIMGPSLLEHDRRQRVLQLRAAADRAVLTLPPAQLAQLQAYARGINAFLEGNDNLPVEFHLLHYKPMPWTPRDSLLVGLAMFQDLSTGYPTKLSREAFARHLPPELLADLYSTHSFRDQPPTQPPHDLTAPQGEVLQIPLDDSQVKLRRPSLPATPPQLLKALASLQPDCPECRAGSNNWAVSGSHSASGKPLLSNDMHLGLGIPAVWYEAGLHVAASPDASPAEPALDVAGFTLPGVPFVVVGRNAHVAWGFTNLGADVQDLHIEHLRGTGEGTEFQQPDGSWVPVAHHRELIRVRGGRDRELDVLTTSTRIGAPLAADGAAEGAGTEAVATPIVSTLLPGEQRALSLLWTAYDPHNLSLPFYFANAAASGSALVASLASFGGPSLNLIYADEAGHIGYHAIGRIPVRGPAERRPRALPEQIPADNGNPLPDEGAEGSGSPTPDDSEPAKPDEPQAHLNSEPAKPQARRFFPEGSFLAASYSPPQRRLGRRTHPADAARTPVRREAARRGRPQPATPPKQAPAELLPAPPAARGYTIGFPAPTVPLDALDASARWSGYVPFEELPAIVDPADGVLATANARVTADDYPYFLGDNWAPPYRVERIRKLLAGRTGLTPADMLHIETDTTSAFDRLLGERLVYAIDHASPKALKKDGKRLHQAADLLRTWSGGTPGDMAVGSPAAAIVSAVRPELWSMLLAPPIARHDHLSPTDSSLPTLAALYEWGAQTVALESLLTFQPARWLPAGYGTWNDLLAAAVLRGLAAKSAPHDLSRWKYGSLHAVEIQHPLFSLSPLLARLLGVPAGTGAQPIGGDGTTVQATSRAFGPSERFTADLADPGATLGNITTGQSGNPRSPNFLDQFPAWLHGASFARPLRGAPAQHTLRLLP